MLEPGGRPPPHTERKRGRSPANRRSIAGGVAALAALGLTATASLAAPATAAEPASVVPSTATGDAEITLSMSVQPGQPVPLGLIRDKASSQYDDVGATGQGIDVAIVDSGVSPVFGLHQPGKIVYGPDLSNEAAMPNLANLDTFGHGTHLAGIIAGNDGDEVLGIAPDSRIVSLKVAGATGETHVAQVIAAIDWVVDHRFDNGMNIRVLNLSLGVEGIPTTAGDPLSAAVERAWHAGIVVVAAAGNRGNYIGGVDSPALSPYVLSVGATESYTSWGREDTVPTWSSGGNSYRTPDVLAPGRSIMSLRVPGSFLDTQHPNAIVDGKYFVGSGTSQSAAVQSGYVAGLLSRNPALSPDQVKWLFMNYSKDMIPGDIIDGNGKINPKASARRIKKAAEAPIQKYVAAIPAGNGAPAGATWTGGDWNGASWSGGTWSGASWSGASWSGASWSGASWSGASWSSASWSGASWSGASWSGASWSGASWSGASWSGASWSGAGWSLDGPDAPVTENGALGSHVVETAQDHAVDALLQQEDVLYDTLEKTDDALVDELIANEDELHDTLLGDVTAIGNSLLEETSPIEDPTIVADVALVDSLIDTITGEVAP